MAQGYSISRRFALALGMGALLVSLIQTASAAEIGRLETVFKNEGSNGYYVEIRATFGWSGIYLTKKRLMAARVPNTGQQVKAVLNLPGGTFSATSYIKGTELTTLYIAKAATGASKSKTTRIDLNKVKKVEIRWFD